MRVVRKLVVVALLVLFAPGPHPNAAPLQLPLFSTEQAAQAHCPADIVVWLNIPSAIYHFKGQRWYGRTKNGAYVCKAEADNTGARATQNGQ